MRLNGAVGVVLAASIMAACGPTTSSSSAVEPASLPIDADWSLDTEASRLGFVSIKSGEVIEAHSFSGLTGLVTSAGSATVTIPLDQVETKIDIRNERMREMLFETATYPVATLSASLEPEMFADLSIGDRSQLTIEGNVSLHGVDVPMAIDVAVTRIAETQIEVASVEPVILYVEDFNLAGGLEALREIAGLPAITAASPVTFAFVFAADDS